MVYFSLIVTFIIVSVNDNKIVFYIGYDFNKGLDYHELFKTMMHCGFQATNFALAIEQINQMLQQRNIPLTEEQMDMEEDEFIKRKSQCTIFLGYTSNMVSSGVRETIRFLVQHKLVGFIILLSIFLCDNKMYIFLGRLYRYHSWWSRRRFYKMFGTHIYWQFLFG